MAMCEIFVKQMQDVNKYTKQPKASNCDNSKCPFWYLTLSLGVGVGK